MEEIAISKFKATCLAVLERVRKTRKPILVTRFGNPVAQIGPPEPASAEPPKLGGMKGRATILDDIIEPVADLDEWEAARG